SKILANTKKGKLPKTVNININSLDGINNNGKTLIHYNIYSPTKLSKYLKSTKWAPSKNAFIKALAKKITKGKKTDYEKAEAIFNWLNKQTNYSFYYNSKYGAIKTIKLKKGNCVDISHAYTAIARSIGLPTRYIHGKCTFKSGKPKRTGHVWVQVLVNKVWIPVDLSNLKNRFGAIVSWNPYTYKKYSVLSKTPW
ncbi:MAG: transglutaminase-like domain-containing protein, partial [Methanobrevibacter sp.]|nr:transglutaminase-like domain-containing protein [Methanobrevibacter sp.]